MKVEKAIKEIIYSPGSGLLFSQEEKRILIYKFNAYKKTLTFEETVEDLKDGSLVNMGLNGFTGDLVFTIQTRTSKKNELRSMVKIYSLGQGSKFYLFQELPGVLQTYSEALIKGPSCPFFLPRVNGYA